MQQSTVLITKNTLSKAQQKAQKQLNKTVLDTKIKSKYQVRKFFDIDSAHYYDTTGMDGFRLEMIPSSGSEIIDLIKRFDIRTYDESNESVAEKIAAVKNSDYAKRYLFINAMNSDPALIQDEWLLKYKPGLVELGIRALKKTCYFSRTVIAAHFDADLDCAETVLCDYGFTYSDDIKYISDVLEIECDEKENPATNGVLSINVQALIAVGLAASGVAPTTRFLTMADMEKEEATVVCAPVGQLASELLYRIYGRPEGLQAYAGSGALNARPLELLPEIDFTTSFVAYGKPAELNKPEKCKVCEDCENVCPVKLPMQFIVRAQKQAAKKKNLIGKDSRKYQDIEMDKIIDTCIRCNACTYVCPAGIDTMNMILDFGKELAQDRIISGITSK